MILLNFADFADLADFSDSADFPDSADFNDFADFADSIPKIPEREGNKKIHYQNSGTGMEWKIPFPTFGTGIGGW